MFVLGADMIEASETVTSVGVGGMLLLMVVRQVFEFLNGKNGIYKQDSNDDSKTRINLEVQISSINASLQELKNKLPLLEDLHRWHNVRHPTIPGHFVWWNNYEEIARVRDEEKRKWEQTERQHGEICDLLEQISVNKEKN